MTTKKINMTILNDLIVTQAKWCDYGLIKVITKIKTKKSDRWYFLTDNSV